MSSVIQLGAIMKKIILILILSFSGLVFGQDTPVFDYNIEAYQLTQQFTALNSQAEPDIAAPPVSGDPEMKKPGKAFMLSAMMPGLGEIYAGSRWKAALFFAIEVAAWTGTAVYNAEGKDKEKIFENFANSNWVKEDYWDWLRDVGDGVEWDAFMDSTNYPTTWDHELYNEFEDFIGMTHNLPETKTQQYYEMIGKYMVQFGAGWSDALKDTTALEGTIYYWPLGTTNNSEYYMDVRGQSNDALNISSLFVQIVMLNHVASALDAGFTVRLKNRKIETAMDLYPRMYRGETVAMGRMTVNF